LPSYRKPSQSSFTPKTDSTRYRDKANKSLKSSDNFPDKSHKSVKTYKVGQKVEHPRFGLGVIKQVQEGRLKVVFKTGPKTLMAEYAPLKLVE
jgi:hypothetical protein